MLITGTLGDKSFYDSANEGLTRLRHSFDFCRFGRAYRESIRPERHQEKRPGEPSEEKAEAWDELKKSVLTKLADDILVGIRSERVSISILKVLC